MNATMHILGNPSLLINMFFAQLPAVAVFFGISHLVLRNITKIKIRSLVALAYLVAPILILAVSGWSIRAEKFSEGVRLLVPLVLSALACGVLYFHEWRRQVSRKPSCLLFPNNGRTADIPVVENPASSRSVALSHADSRPLENTGSGTIYCDQCGKPANPGAKFCHSCGHRLRVEMLSMPAQLDTPTEEAESSSITESAPESMIEQSERAVSEQLPSSAPTSSETAIAVHRPWRRLFARTVDMAIAVPVLYLLLFKNFGEAHPLTEWFVGTDGAVWLLTHPVAAAALILTLWVLIEAVCLMAFGATLGKWAFGIQVLDAGGKKLTFGAAFNRSWQVLLFGQALGVPFAALITGILAYRRLNKTSSTIWDQFAESSVSYKNWAPVGMVVCAAVTMVAIIGFILTPVIIASLNKSYWAERIEWAPEPARSAVSVTPVAPESNQSVVKGRLTPEELQYYVFARSLEKTHPDWQTIMNSPEFQYWRDYVIFDGPSLKLSKDSEYISRRLTAFKEWREKQRN
ncbi:RDD family protein [Dechloromonas sp. H13]|uniref:RDD family protein n=1 Tax=Dechloromonas sp. H13 TaxID=2570193 RepID=UPI00188551DB|nr:RDD family protein [Dechloromonas sp. H13]